VIRPSRTEIAACVTGCVAILLLCFDAYYFFVRRGVGPGFYVNKFFGDASEPILTQPEYRELVNEYERLNLLTKGQSVTVFLGDSLTKAFNVSEYFADRHVLNRGINSDTTVGLLARLDRNVANLDVNALFLLIGFNDLKLRDDSAILANIERILANIKARRIYVQSLLPVTGRGRETTERILGLNAKLRRLCVKNNVEYIDLYTHFSNAKGELLPRYSLDGAHINGAGYRLWSELIRDKVQGSLH
jgi:lysophospholipase L1-like esterase